MLGHLYQLAVFIDFIYNGEPRTHTGTHTGSPASYRTTATADTLFNKITI